MLHLFCVEMDETEGIFEMAEGSFNSPASGIEALEFNGWECVGRQIGNNGFKVILGELEANDTERKLIENKRIVLAVAGGDEIKGRGR